VDISTRARPRGRQRGGNPRTVVRALSARRAVRSGVLWGYLFGVVVASSALSYARIYPSQADRDRLEASFGRNSASSALFGPAHQLQTVAGFTVFKSSMTLTIVGAVWGLLISTRLLRGEEDSGRWELLLAGRTTRKGATTQTLQGLFLGVGALWAVTSVLIVIVGLDSKVDFRAGPSLYFALGLVSSAAVFVAVGSLTSQLAQTRRQAATYAGWVLGISYALRMVTDAGAGLHGLIWVSPLGWAEQLQPMTSPQPFALLPMAVFTGAAVLVAVHLSGSRDLGGAMLGGRRQTESHLRPLTGHFGLTIRLERPTVMTWTLAIAATGFVMGLVAKAAGATISGSSVHTVFSRLGVRGEGTRAYLGVAFLTIAILVALLGSAQIVAARSEEAEGHLDHLLVRPVRRSSWLSGRLSVATASLVFGGLLAGLMTWLGAQSQGASMELKTLLDAGVNVVPPAICLLGLGAAAFGLWPRATTPVVYGVLTWSLLVEVIGGFGTLSHWILDTSLFHQMAAVPATEPNWTTNGTLVAVGLVAAVTGVAAFRTRDIEAT
jgi:ABC-2 type transport system permease protein